MAEGMKGKNTNAMELTGLLRNVAKGVIFFTTPTQVDFSCECFDNVINWEIQAFEALTSKKTVKR